MFYYISLSSVLYIIFLPETTFFCSIQSTEQSFLNFSLILQSDSSPNYIISKYCPKYLELLLRYCYLNAFIASWISETLGTYFPTICFFPSKIFCLRLIFILTIGRIKIQIDKYIDLICFFGLYYFNLKMQIKICYTNK